MSVKNTIKQEFIEAMGDRIHNGQIILETDLHTEHIPFQHEHNHVTLIEIPLCCLTHSIEVDVFLSMYTRIIKHLFTRKGKRLQAILKQAQKPIKGNKEGNGHAPFIIQWLKDGVEF